MSDTNRKFVFAYALLVLLPVLGLAGILDYGRGLTAPLSVDGVWRVEAGSKEMAYLLCVNADVFIYDGSVVISQSGKQLSLKIGTESGPVVMGLIEKSTITPSFLPSATS